MASSNNGGGGGGEDQPPTEIVELSKTLKDGERILAPTRRPDGTLRKPIRIRAGYVPQEEVAIYQSKGALWKKEMSSQTGPPGFDDTSVDTTKPKTKSVKRNERKKEKRIQAALEKEKTSESGETKEEEAPVENLGHASESVKSLTSQMNELGVSSSPALVTPPSDSTEDSNPGGPVQDIDKKIRALKKKIRLAEAQQQKTHQQDNKSEQLDKLTKLEGWHKELKLLEDKKKAELTAS
ncbi:PREDICTED: partner of Y14 and mago [Prunus mume]|uniref:Partner of Y14 and mago n=1 Tax=Prunus mume TaxID=102107 RepID=A0ABM1LHI0_PRUMU|nr:PREDICTED: partner of Y14 and mago [Prunus mume]